MIIALSRKIINTISIVGILISIALTIYFFNLGVFKDINALRGLVGDSIILGPIIFILLQILQVVIPIIPGGISSAAGVLIFGPFAGFIYNYVGICIGSIIIFLLGRRYGKPFILSMISDKTYNKYIGWLDNQSRFEKLFAALGKTVDGPQLDQKYREYLTQGHQLLGNSRAIIADLAAKADLYVVTNGVSQTQYKRLKEARLLDYFKDIFVSEDTGYQKPMPEYFDYVTNRIPHFVAKKALVIGDSLTSDIKGANNAGLDSVWLNPDAKQLLPDVKPTYEVKVLEQLYPILGTTFNEKA